MKIAKRLFCGAPALIALCAITVLPQPPQGNAADSIRGLYERNLLSLTEYVCSTDMLNLERTNIIARMNGQTLAPAAYDPLIAKATECISKIGYSFGYFSRAKAHAEKGDPKSALADYEKAISLAKTENSPLAPVGEIYENRADLYISMFDRARAEADLREAIRLSPSDSSAKDKLNDLDKRIAEARKKAALANPQSAADYVIVGEDHFNSGHSDKAVVAFDKSIALSPSVAAYLGKAKALRDLKRSDAAVLELDKALVLGPNNAEVLEWRGRALSDIRHWDAAIADLTKALSLAPPKDKADLLNARGSAYAGKGSYDLALKDQTDSAAASENAFAKINALTGKGRALEGLGRPADAVAAYTEAIGAAGTDYFAQLNLIDTYLYRGRLYASQGKTDLAKADFNSVIKLAPDFSQEAKSELAKLSAPPATPKTAEQWAADGRRAANEKKWDEAIADFGECIKLVAAPPCYALRGVVQGLKGDTTASRADFDKAVSLAPNEPMIYFLRGQMNAQLGNKAAAVSDFRTVLKLVPGNSQATTAREAHGEKP